MNILNFTSSTRRRVAGLCSSLLLALLTTLVLSSPAAAVSVTGGNGASLTSIVGSPTLVTVVLTSGAKDPNLQVVEIQNTVVVFTTDEGDRISYQKTDIANIEVQGDVVEKRTAFVPSTVVLRPEDQHVIDTANARVGELFQSSKDNQELRIWAAAYMAFNGNKDASDYLNSLAKSNNLQTKLDAAHGLYLAGKPLPDGLIHEGLTSNNRNIKAQAAILAGLFRDESATADLMGMLNDRAFQFSAPAAISLARIGNREIISSLLDMLGSTSDEKNVAGVMALTILGGPDVIESVNYRIEETVGLERYRLITVLHNLGAPEGRKHLIRVFNEELTIKQEAALVLAADDYWEAIQYLQERLKRREDPTPDNLIYRARIAHAILQSGDMSAIHVFQSLLRSEDGGIKSFVLDLVADLQDRNLLTLIQPTFRNSDPALSLKACNTAFAISSPEFLKRLQELFGKP